MYSVITSERACDRWGAVVYRERREREERDVYIYIYIYIEREKERDGCVLMMLC